MKHLAYFFFKNRTSQQPFVCANCWGVQEYDQDTFDPVYNRKLDIINGRKKWSFVERFVRTWLTP